MCGLVPDDRHVLLTGDQDVAALIEFTSHALGHDGTGLRCDRDCLGTVRGDETESPGKHEIGSQESIVDSKTDMNGRNSSTRRRSIRDVIMDQGGGMNQLDGSREAQHRSGVPLTSGHVAGNHQSRSNPLPSASQDFATDLDEGRIGSIDDLLDGRFDALKERGLRGSDAHDLLTSVGAIKAPQSAFVNRSRRPEEIR